jgi:septum formation protein
MTPPSPRRPVADPTLVLASASPRRRDLLSLLGRPFEVVVADVEEVVEPGESADEHVARLALTKALAVWERVAREDRRPVVIGADTVVELDGAILGKPTDARDATSTLRRLSGREHHVLSGVAIVHGSDETERITFVERTAVRFVSLTEDEISSYVGSGEPLDKAGAYGIQGIGGRFVAEIDGSYHNVVGLPLAQLAAALDSIVEVPQ